MLSVAEAWLARLPLHVAQLLSALLIAGLTYLVYFLILRALVRMRDRGTLPMPVLVPLARVVRIAAIAIGVMLVLQQFNVLADAWTTITALAAVVGVGFIAVWSILSNAFCALVLLISRPFQIGDDIEIVPEGMRGEVTDFNLIFTILQSEDGSTVQVPNNLFFQKMFRRRRGAVTSGLGEQIEKPSVAK